MCILLLAGGFEVTAFIKKVRRKNQTLGSHRKALSSPVRGIQ
jgi:hypothetical protein